jgi:hypothetical protein
VDRSRPLARPLPDLPPIEAEPPITEDDGQRINIFAEPPIAEEDTRQRRAVTPTSTEELIPVDVEGEPEFLDRVVDLSRFEPPRDPSDTQPGKPVEAPAASAQPTPEPPATPAPSPVGAKTTSIVPPRGEETEPLAYPPRTIPDYRPLRPEPVREPEPEPSILSTPVVKYRELVGKDLPSKPEEAAPAAQLTATEPPAPSPARIYEAAKPEPVPEPVKPAPAPVTPVEADATATKSIWEVFGVPRPSETGEAEAVAPEPALDTPTVPFTPKSAPESETPAEAAASVVAVAPEPPPQAISFPPASTRSGLRLALRRRMVSLRRP